MASAGTSMVSWIFLSFCLDSVVSDCSYLSMHYDNETGTYREEILFRNCPRTEECCGNYTVRSCCPVASQKKSTDADNELHASSLLLIGISSSLVFIGIIAVICWRFVCISAYKEASDSHIRSRGRDTGDHRLTPVEQDDNVDRRRQDRRHMTTRARLLSKLRGAHRHGHGRDGHERHGHERHGHGHDGHGHGHDGHGHGHDGHGHGHGHHHRVHVADEYSTDYHPPAYTQEDTLHPASTLKYLAPPPYDGTAAEIDPPPAYTINITETGDTEHTCSRHVHINIHHGEENNET
ncbi:uncharacterized protein [Argopecten irradians]|uniref:uncharacterized protein isoform X1 n=1 Tax=Argopecten irradians TaxID=31199 RepID=UPI003724368F